MRRCLPLVVVAAAMSLSLPALADNCPPGSWFCADVEVPAPALPPAPVAPAPPQYPSQTRTAQEQARVAQEQARVAQQQARTAQEQARTARELARARAEGQPSAGPPAQGGAPVVIYQPVPLRAPPQVIVITPGYGYGYGGYGYGYPRPPAMSAPAPAPIAARPPPRWQSEWGLNLRVEGVALGHASGGAFNSGLGGVGMSLRYRPVPAFAFDLGADLLMGTDYNGFQRTETPVSLSGMLFLNPRSRAQFYLTAGANFSHADVQSTQQATQLSPIAGGLYGATYTYFGGQGGAGFEFRLSRRVALDLNGVAFLRERIGSSTQQPEFTNLNNGQTTNTSAGGIFRGGFTFWW